MNCLHFLLLLTLFGTGLFAQGEADRRDLLSSHDTVATFSGIEFRTCRGRTSLCPDKCGHSGEFATFAILAYLDYQKPGEYGDPKQESYLIQVSDFQKKPVGDPKIAELLKSLKPGDTVHLMWNHDYVTRGGSKFPERTVMFVQKIDEPEKERLLKKAGVPENP